MKKPTRDKPNSKSEVGLEQRNATALSASGGFLLGVFCTFIFSIPFGGLQLCKSIEIGDLGTWVQSIGVVVGVWYGADQLRIQKEAYKQTTRPYVTASFAHQRDGNWTMELKNGGQSAARKVRVQFDPPYDHAWDDELKNNVGKRYSEWGLFTTGLEYLAPQESLKFHFDDFKKRQKDGRSFDYNLTLFYEDDAGIPFQENRKLDFVVTKDLMVPLPSDLSLIADELKKIGTQLESLSGSAKEIRANTVPRPFIPPNLG